MLLGVRHEQTHKHIAAVGRSAAELSSLRAHRQRGGIARDHALSSKMQRLCLLHRSGRDRLPFELQLRGIAIGVRHALSCKLTKAYRLRDQMVFRLQRRTVGCGAHVQISRSQADTCLHHAGLGVRRAVEQLRKRCLKRLSDRTGLPLLQIADRRAHAPLHDCTPVGDVHLVEQHGLRMAQQAVSFRLPVGKAVHLRCGERLLLHGHRHVHAQRF